VPPMGTRDIRAGPMWDWEVWITMTSLSIPPCPLVPSKSDGFNRFFVFFFGGGARLLPVSAKNSLSQWPIFFAVYSNGLYTVLFV